nr:hypothetical protein [Tanacetum cinerariifolium]
MGKGLFGPNGRRDGKVEVGFDNFGGGGEEIRNCGGNGGRGSFIFRRGEGSLVICSMESKDDLGGGGLVVVGGRSSSVSKIAWGEVGGAENKSLMGSMLIAKGEECLDGWVRASRGEVKGGGVDLGVTKSLLGEILGESGSEEFRVDGGAVFVLYDLTKPQVPASSIQLDCVEDLVLDEHDDEASLLWLSIDEENLDLDEQNVKQYERKICDGHYPVKLRVLSSFSFGVTPYNYATLENIKVMGIDRRHLVSKVSVDMIDHFFGWLLNVHSLVLGYRDEGRLYFMPFVLYDLTNPQVPASFIQLDRIEDLVLDEHD